MDITKRNWPENVQAILTHISSACFVSLDFELSGISMKINPVEKNVSLLAAAPKLHTVQQRYLAVKAAAEQYQILQVGITTVHEDGEKDGYVLRPFNINLSPILRDSALEINRTFSLQSSSMAFLLEHGFDLQKSVAEGVPYLSRYDEVQLRLKDKIQKERKHPILVRSLTKNPLNLGFEDGIRHRIDTWLQEKRNQDNTDAGPDASVLKFARLDGIERKVLRKLVQSEYPTIVIVDVYETLHLHEDRTKREMTFEEEAERKQAVAKYQSSLFNTNLQRMVGLRYIMDALTVSNTLGSVNPLHWSSEPTVVQRRTVMQQKIRQFEKLKKELKRPTVLVGHNVFVDLVNFYHCFIGELPEDVDTFADRIHGLFPCVIDTKYLATHHNGERDARSALEELHLDLKDMESPRIILHEDHSRYESVESLHEAGYDSYVTACAALRLAGKMDAMDHYQSEREKQSNQIKDYHRHGFVKMPSEELAEIFDTEAHVRRKEAWSMDDILKLQIPNLVPGLENVWRKYGNHLRINGTLEGLLVLRSARDGSSSDGN